MIPKTTCEKCGQSLLAPPSRAGAQAKCPKCGQAFTVPWALSCTCGRTLLLPRQPRAAVSCPDCGKKMALAQAEAKPVKATPDPPASAEPPPQSVPLRPAHKPQEAPLAAQVPRLYAREPAKAEAEQAHIGQEPPDAPAQSCPDAAQAPRRKLLRLAGAFAVVVIAASLAAIVLQRPPSDRKPTLPPLDNLEPLPPDAQAPTAQRPDDRQDTHTPTTAHDPAPPPEAPLEEPAPTTPPEDSAADPTPPAIPAWHFPPKVGKAAPEIVLDRWWAHEAQGRNSLADYKGEHVVLHFIAPTCARCAETANALSNIYERYRRGPVRVHVLGIARVVEREEAWVAPGGTQAQGMDVKTGDTPSAMRDFLQRAQPAYPVASDKDGETLGRYGMEPRPTEWLRIPDEGVEWLDHTVRGLQGETCYLVGPEGEILWMGEGGDAALTDLLAEMLLR